MAALLEGLPAEAGAPAPPAIQQMAADGIREHTSTASVYKSKMPELVKGAGYCGPGGNAPLTDQTAITAQAAQATLDLRAETMRGFRAKTSVVKSMNPAFLGKYGALATALSQPSMYDVLSAIPGGAEALKSFTAGNLGIGSVA